METENYLLTSQEFILLAATAGITSLRGFDMNVDGIDREQAVAALQELTRRGLLENNGERFLAAGEIGDIFSVIREADTTLEVHKKSGKKCLFYLGEAAVKVALSARRPGVYEVMRMESADVWKHLTEEGWIPERHPETEAGWLPGQGAGNREEGHAGDGGEWFSEEDAGNREEGSAGQHAGNGGEWFSGRGAGDRQEGSAQQEPETEGEWLSARDSEAGQERMPEKEDEA
ncbi:MAG: hypothetical protein LIO75_06405 [Lachnospiraceae bacterium]|nr:hypothetical protein [Lachnospiraceae bacterium]